MQAYVFDVINVIGLANTLIIGATVLAGACAVIFVLRAWGKLGGKFKAAMEFFVTGVFLSIVDSVFPTMSLPSISVGEHSIDMQILIMFFAMICFVASGYRFAKMVAHS